VVHHDPSGRSPNITADEAGYCDVEIIHKDWNEVFPPAFDRLYRSLSHGGVSIPRRSQERRVIDSEGDVG